MGKKHGTLKGGRRLRRGNNAGSLYLKGGVYMMRFTERTPDGKRVRRAWSTGTGDLEAARKMLEDKANELGYGASEADHIDALLTARRNLENERARLERERDKREAEERKAAEEAAAAERDRKAITFSEAFIIYCDSKKRPDSGPATLAHYEGQYNRFAAWVKEAHPQAVKLKDFTPQMAEEFIDYIERTQSRSTRNKYLVFLRMFWRVLRWEEDAQLTIDPWDGIRNLTATPDEVIRKELTIDELINIGRVIRTDGPLPLIREKGNAKRKAGNLADVFMYQGESIRDEIRALFSLGIYTGLRLGDCALLQWGDVDLVRGIVNTMPSKTARKYKRRVIIPIHPMLEAVLTETPAGKRNGPILPKIADLYSHCDSMLTRRIQTIMRAAGIKTDATPNGESGGTRTRTLAGFHSLRHTFSSIMLNAGVSSTFVDAMLCHAKSSMTMRYFHENANALADAVLRLPMIGELAESGKAAKTALEGARARTLAAMPVDNADASTGLLEAIGANIYNATTEDLEKAAKMIADALATRTINA